MVSFSVDVKKDSVAKVVRVEACTSLVLGNNFVLLLILAPSGNKSYLCVSWLNQQLPSHTN
jgi:hypothetical protein